MAEAPPPTAARPEPSAPNTEAAQVIIPLYQGKPAPWAIYRHGQETEYRPVFEWAKNLADQRYPVGRVVIEHIEDPTKKYIRERGQWREEAQSELALGEKR